MGRRGPKPKTDTQKKLDGNPGRRPATGAGTGWPTGAPTRPAWLLNPLAIATWDEVVPQIAAAGILSPLDRVSLASYCLSVARYIEAEQWMDREGTVCVIRSDKGEVKNQGPAPEFVIAIKYLEKANQLAEKFGLTPVSRQTLKTSDSHQSALTAFLAAAKGTA